MTMTAFHRASPLTAALVFAILQLAPAQAFADFSVCQSCPCCQTEYDREKKSCLLYGYPDTRVMCLQLADDDFKECKGRLCKVTPKKPKALDIGISTMSVENTRNCRTYLVDFQNQDAAGTFYLYLYNGISDQLPNVTGVDDVVLTMNGSVVVPTGTVTKLVPIHSTPITLASGANHMRVDVCSTPTTEPMTAVSVFIFDGEVSP